MPKSDLIALSFLMILLLMGGALITHLFEVRPKGRVFVVSSRHGEGERVLAQELAHLASQNLILLGLEGFGRHDERLLSDVFRLSNSRARESVVGLENKGALQLASLLLHYGYFATDLEAGCLRAEKSLLESLARDEFFGKLWRQSQLQESRLARLLEKIAVTPNAPIEKIDLGKLLNLSPEGLKTQWLSLYRKLIATLRAQGSFERVDNQLVDDYLNHAGDQKLQVRIIESVLGAERNQHMIRNSQSLVQRARILDKDLFLIVGEEHVLALESGLNGTIQITPDQAKELARAK